TGTSPANSVVWASIADSTTDSDNLLSVLHGSGIASNGSGGNFTAIYPNNSPLPDFCAPLCFYSMKLAAMPQSAGGALFAGGSAQPQLGPNAFGTSSVYRSLDGGNTWADVSADGSGNGTSTHSHVHTFSFANAANGSAVALYIGNDGGVWVSTDVFKAATSSGSQHWADLNTNTGNANTSLNITQFYPGMSVHPSSDQILFGGTQGNDAQQYIGSLPWSDTLACPWDGGYTAIDPETPTTIYAACNYLSGPGTITKNTQNGIPGNDGVNWGAIDFNNGIDFSDNADFIPPFVLDSNASSNLYFGTYRLFQSTNAGMTWTAISSDLTTDGLSEYVTAISVAPSNSNVIYAGTSDGLLWQSTKALSGATDIHKVNQNGQPARQVSVISVDSTNPQFVFAAYSGFSCPGWRHRLRRTRPHFLFEQLGIVLGEGRWKFAGRSRERPGDRSHGFDRQHDLHRDGRGCVREHERDGRGGNYVECVGGGAAQRASAVAEAAKCFADACCGNARARSVEYSAAWTSRVRVDRAQSGQRKRGFRRHAGQRDRERVHTAVRRERRGYGADHNVRQCDDADCRCSRGGDAMRWNTFAERHRPDRRNDERVAVGRCRFV
ncbi:MAG: hypothetical protein ABSC71_20370, partial [Candidatus Acidiferrales bacterium]